MYDFFELWMDENAGKITKVWLLVNRKWWVPLPKFVGRIAHRRM